MNQISLKYSLSEEDYLEACHAYWYQIKQSPGDNLKRAGYCLLATLVLFCVNRFFEYSYWLAVLFAIFAALFILKVLSRPTIWRGYYRKLERYKGEISVDFCGDMQHIRTLEGDFEQERSVYESFYESNKYVIFIIGVSNFSVIPKHAFDSDEKLQLFLADVRNRTKELEKR